MGWWSLQRRRAVRRWRYGKRNVKAGIAGPIAPVASGRRSARPIIAGKRMPTGNSPCPHRPSPSASLHGRALQPETPPVPAKLPSSGFLPSNIMTIPIKSADIPGFCFFVVWAVLPLSSWILMRRAKTAKAKRAIHRVMVFISGALIIAFACILVGGRAPLAVLFMVVPVVALITFTSLRTTRFCPKCTREVRNSPLWRKAEFCPYCGARLDSNEINGA